MTDRVDCIVIGAGVVGLAVAREIALRGFETIIIEAQSAIGTGTSSRNSGVIHAGIYYPRNTAKVRLCVAGRELLYSFCDAHAVSHDKCGKLVVATSQAQVGALRAISESARANGVDDLKWLEGTEARALEPALECVAAIHSPSTGIIDAHAFMTALQGDFEAAGGMIAFNGPMLAARRESRGITVAVGGDSPVELQARTVVNSAGLFAQETARRVEGLARESIPPLYYAKGNYFTLADRSPFRRLIYPVPESGGLGVHLTLDLGGRARFGPDVEWVERIDYTVDAGRAAAFEAQIRKYWPGLPDGALQPGDSGIRPKLHAADAAPRDFVIQSAEAHGVPGLINLYGIESPGLTAALALGRWVADLAL